MVAVEMALTLEREYSGTSIVGGCDGYLQY